MAISVQNLTKYYGREKAVENISFEVKTGEILGFLGPNGAGKTTTMKIITCYMPPSSGTVEVDGYNIFEHSMDVRRKIGYLPELNPLYLDMNVVEYLDYAARLQGMNGGTITQRLKHMVEVCGLGNMRHKDIGELSKGYRQRVGLAQAMIHDPEMLILDEPTSGLDPNQIVEIRKLIKDIGEKKTVILSTHILSEVQATCDRVIIINEGTIVADGSPEKLQQEFRGAEVITVEIKSNESADAIAQKLKSLANVESVERIATDGALSHSFTLMTAKGSDIREELFNRAVAERWVLLELTRKGTSLEEIFHKLTRAES
ncbi:MAG: ATP-binding cassette domain-containing protein [Ignavibacteriae bacterium]|nr:ATP-binding cassette domain-containing protein [Ignavibacteriota bacterium]